MRVREMVCAAIGTFGGWIVCLLGGWDNALAALIAFMVVDYLSGLVVAAVFKKSNKSESGALDSRAGWKGLCRKGMTLAFVLVANMLDVIIGVEYIRTAVIMGFCANELISIMENAGLMGIPLPSVLQKAIEVLTQKSESQKG